jgi:hypothetical protein
MITQAVRPKIAPNVIKLRSLKEFESWEHDDHAHTLLDGISKELSAEEF